ncbi:MAG: RHS repeat-associated core domain-containing protein [Gammaproteobacteria bacterium]|nr:RHS repeat-associated core domain-containing protein [Gammaproteobacteria bacterium]
MALPQRRPGLSRPSHHRHGRGRALRAGPRYARPAHALPFMPTPLSPKPHIGHFFSSPAPHRGNPSLSPWTHRGNRVSLRRPTSGDPLPGQYFDNETGLHYNYFRDYDPSTGRYIESDPIGLIGGLNTYEYANSDPIFWTDPMGLTSASVWNLTRRRVMTQFNPNGTRETTVRDIPVFPPAPTPLERIRELMPPDPSQSPLPFPGEDPLRPIDPFDKGPFIPEEPWDPNEELPPDEFPDHAFCR